MSGYYSKYQPYELDGFIDDLVSKKFKLADKINQFDKIIQKETIWLKSTTDTDFNLSEMIESLKSTKLLYETILQNKNSKYNTKKDTLLEELQDQEALEIEITIAKIKQKYQQKYNKIDSILEGYMTNDNRKIEAFENKIQGLEHAIPLKREKLMEEKKSKIIINAESEKAIVKKELDEIDMNIAEIQAELKKKLR